MRAASLFSGIGAPEVAMPNWDWIWHAEIEPFPSAVMAARHPQSVNLGDVTADDFCDRALAIGRPDVLVFGSPCQSFSVAGKRLGLDDPRGNLALVALGIVARLEPAWFVFENVPGLLSSSAGADFGWFLRAVGDIGRAGVWRVLDAQYDGVAQRRRRVFFVGSVDWRRAAAVLLESASVQGHPPARGEARQDVALPVTSRVDRGGAHREAHGNNLVAPALRGSGPGCARSGDSRGQDPLVVASTIGRTHGNVRADEAWTGRLIPEISPAMKARDAKGVSSDGDGDGDGLPLIPVLAHALKADGFDASEDGTGRGTPLVPVQCNGSNVGTAEIPSLRRGNGNVTGGVPAVFDPRQVTSPDNRSQPTPGLSHTLHAEAPVAFGWNKSASQTMRVDEHLAPAVQASEASNPAVLTSGVRRLVPAECEILQGLPRDYTNIRYRGKPAKDGPRYKAIGNSMAVPCIGWILRRIELLEQLISEVA